MSSIDNRVAVTLLTGGSDRPYVFGITTSLASKGIILDVIGSDELDCPELRKVPDMNFFNLRADQRPDVGFAKKAVRLSTYYMRLIRYAATAKPRIFHILWNNKFEVFDRTLLMVYYKMLGKSTVITAHNVNAAKRDSKDTYVNRLTLGIQYRLANHIFVHTERMKCELVEEFGVKGGRVTVIPFGINNSVPNTRLTPAEARERLGLNAGERTLLFFGRIKPYKGLEYLIAAYHEILARRKDYRLIIVGRPFGSEGYWTEIRDTIREDVANGRVVVREEFIPDEETEVYFKAADALVLPYKAIYQSGVLFLAHSFGLPVLAANVGALRDEIVDGETGFVFDPEDSIDLAKTIEAYFASDLYQALSSRRQRIKDYATRRHSWDIVSQMTLGVYAKLLQISPPSEPTNSDLLEASRHVTHQPRG